MATRIAFVLVVALYLSGSRIPGRLELSNPDVEVTGSAKRLISKRSWTAPTEA